MRTKLTMDPDTNRWLQQTNGARGRTLRKIVNFAVRRGLMVRADAPDRPTFVFEARTRGRRPKGSGVITPRTAGSPAGGSATE